MSLLSKQTFTYFRHLIYTSLEVIKQPTLDNGVCYVQLSDLRVDLDRL